MRPTMIRSFMLALSLMSPACGNINAPNTASDFRAEIITDAGGNFVERLDGTRIPLLDLSSIRDESIKHQSEIQSSVLSGEKFLAPASYSLASSQTPIKNQQDRRTCWIFAAVGAIEAKYKRDFGVSLDLSEQYFNHASKSTGLSYPRIYRYENQSSYWGGGGSHVVAEAKNYLIPLESFAPYKNQTQMDAIKAMIPAAGALAWQADPALNLVAQAEVDAFEYSPLYIPTAARMNAKYGVASYRLFDGGVARDTSALENLIASNREVVIDIDLKWKYNSRTGVYEHDATSAGGGHAFVLIGYDRAGGWFLVKNSWGDSGFLKVTYDFLQRNAQSAAVVDSVFDPATPPQDKAKWMGFWHQDHDGWKGRLVVRRITGSGNAPVRLGTYYGQDGLPHTVNGISIDNNHGLQYFVANESENAPGTLSGQKFEVDQYSHNPTHAAGTTWWGASGQGGVYLGRQPANAPYSNTFAPSEWIGTWNMNHDGWTGVLRISAVTATAGDYRLTLNYTDAGGIGRTATGILERARPTIARISINFPTSQAFTLHYHNWDDNLASGSTLWSGIRFGVHAVKSR